MKVEPAKKSDYARVAELYRALYSGRSGHGKRGFGPPKLLSTVLVARERIGIVGFVIATFTSYASSRFGYIEELFVDADHRHSGVGGMLVKSALEWETRNGADVVFVTTENEADFYVGIGFRYPKRNTWLRWTPGSATRQR